MTNLAFWVLDEDEPEVRARFKWVNPRKPFKSSLYSFGAEYVSTTLARQLDLPTAEIYLEEIDGDTGLVSLRVPGVPWSVLSHDTIRAATFVDKKAWPRYMVFDVLVANHDRTPDNLFVEWDPPLRRPLSQGEQATLWLIDYGFSCLWPVYKFGENLSLGDIQGISPDADLRTEFTQALRNNAPPQYYMRFPFRGSTERAQAIEFVRRITEDDIEQAVAKVPKTYMTKQEAELTAAFLRGRLARIDTLVDTVFPM